MCCIKFDKHIHFGSRQVHLISYFQIVKLLLKYDNNNIIIIVTAFESCDGGC